ncbi:hypothetical protein [Roseivirga thermotolerans]|jgi:hypothetical protein|uniref:DUF304 domain-containing protein n=1 Tax=Roseivirga thermotolerans TaxID=1758176 RepID=A0ABQ3IC15_9BACT|nr:hypothetical protein [Roseivirga thermotolerans]GHE75055.1 hypothetical protein GCM10011340_34880 [Roseivirga thermotolerans]
MVDELDNKMENTVFKRSIYSYTSILISLIVVDAIWLSGYLSDSVYWNWVLIGYNAFAAIFLLLKVFKVKVVTIQSGSVKVIKFFSSAEFKVSEIASLEKETPQRVCIALKTGERVRVSLFDLKASDRERFFRVFLNYGLVFD